MKAFAATMVAVILMTTSASCSSDEDDDQSAPQPPAASGSAPTVPTPSAGSDGAQANDLEVDDGVMALSTNTRGGTSCFDGDIVDYGWFDTSWRSHTDLDSVRFRLEGSTGVRVVGSPTTIPPVNFGGRIDYGGMIEWSDKSPLANDRVIRWSSRGDTDFLSPIEDQTGLLLFHLRFDGAALTGKQSAALGDLVAAYTTLEGETATVTLDIDQRFTVGKKACGAGGGFR